MRAGQAEPAAEREEGLGEPGSSSSDDQRDDDPATSEGDRDDS